MGDGPNGRRVHDRSGDEDPVVAEMDGRGEMARACEGSGLDPRTHEPSDPMRRPFP